MTFKPSIIAWDVETALTDGTPHTEYYRADFRVTTSAFAWRGEDGAIKTRYYVGEAETRAQLEKIQRAGIPTVVHSLQFEYGVTKYRFPGLESVITWDTMRLVQVADNGGKKAFWDEEKRLLANPLDEVDEDAPKLTSGLGLEASASRFLEAELRGHKQEAYKWLRSHGVKAGTEGANLNLLPPEILERYNVADAIVTLRLHETLMALFAEKKYSPDLDHRLYASSARRIAERKGLGVPIDIQRLSFYRAKVKKEIDAIETNFRDAFGGPIAEVEADAQEAWVKALKSERGQIARRAQLEANPALIAFKILSTQQLKRLFVDKLGITPKFMTEESKKSKEKRKLKPDMKPFEPKPSFKASHLATYGAGGELLIERRKRLLVLSQVENLLALSARDGRWHVDLKAAGTVTGRMAGGRLE